MAGLQGRVIGGYQLADQLSSGGIAEVYRARPTTPGGREAVVKVIYPEFVQQPGFRARFDQIVQTAGRLSHPHILPLLGSGEQNGYLYLVTPFVAAGTLRDWLVSGRRLGTHDVAPFFRQLCEAVGYAHSQSVMHGDIKPSNIFVHEGRHVLLGDFGRLWDVGQIDMTHAGPGIEAVQFLAPEAMDGRANPRSDIYSLGAVLFASLAGRPPYGGATPFEVFTKHRQHPIPQLAEASPPVPADVRPLDSVVQQAMAKAPDARFSSAPALAQAIETTIRSAAARPAVMPGGPTPFGGVGIPAAMAGAMSPGAMFAPLGQGMGPTPGAELGKASFPPLPMAGLVDPTMEEGRLGSAALGSVPLHGSSGLAGAQSTGVIRPFASPGAVAPIAGGPSAGLDVPVQPTLRVAASPGASTTVVSGSRPGASGPSDLTAQPTARVPAPPQSGPSGAGRLAPVSPGELGDGASERMVPQIPPVGGGFMVAGGAPGAAGSTPARFGSEPGARPADSQAPAEHAVDGQFSATRLGLPRLTTPDMGDLPPSWREIASEHLPAASPAWGAAAGAGSPAEPEEPPSMWGDDFEPARASRRWGEAANSGASEAAPRSHDDHSSQWTGSENEGSGWSGEMSSQTSVPDLFASSSLTAIHPEDDDGADSGRGQRGAKRRRTFGFSGPFSRKAPAVAHDEEDDGRDPFADPSAWARPADAGYHGGYTRLGRVAPYRDPTERRRRLGPLLFFMMVLLVVDSVLVVAYRPDLCPHNRCAGIHASLNQFLAGLHIPGVPPPETIAPDHLTVEVAAGATATASLTLADTGNIQGTWTATSDLKWITVTPATGKIGPHSSAKLTVTVTPSASTPVGSYTAMATLTGGLVPIKVPIVVSVTAPNK